MKRIDKFTIYTKKIEKKNLNFDFRKNTLTISQ